MRFRLRPTRLACILLLILFTSILFHIRSASYDTYDKPIPYIGPYQSLNPEAAHGFLPLQKSIDLCQTRRLDAYTTRDRRRKVYDLFLISTEMDWAEIRFNELSPEVDYFIVLESDQTFQEEPKPLHFQNNLHLFQPFHPKIIHQVVNLTTTNLLAGNTWAREHFTRNALFDQVLASLTGDQAPQQGDVLIVGDVDEIPRVSTLTVLRNCAFPPRVTLLSHFYYYSFQWLHRGAQWPHPQATFYNGPDLTIQPESLRNDPSHLELWNAAWHCSSCMSTLAEVMGKITSFSHKAYNHPYILDPEKLLAKIKRGEDIFERRDQVFDRVDENMDVPGFLLREENRASFGYMLDRDGAGAGFRDMVGTG